MAGPNRRRPGRRPRGAGGGAAAGAPAAAKSPPPPLAVQLLAGLALLAAAVLVNLPTLRFEFLNWDDGVYVVDNPWIRGWTRENLQFIFTKPYFSNFLPLHLLSYLVDYSLWGLKPFGYHLQNVVLNALNALLGFLVVRRLLGSFSVALVAGLLFAVHPAKVEAVAWVSSRKEILSTTFMLLSFYAYLRARERRALAWAPYAASLLLFTLALLSKVSAVVLPAALLAVDWLRRSRREGISWRVALASKIPYAVLGLWLVRVNSAAQVTAKAAYAQEPLRYLMVKGHAVWNYLALLTGVPHGNPDYDTPQLSLGFLSAVLNLAGLAVLPAVFWFAVRRRHRALALGAAWIFTTLLPAILFPLVTYMADRYLYAPALGFCWILAAGIVAAGKRIGSTRARTAAVGAAAVLLGGWFSYGTVRGNRIWSDSETLWTYAMTRSRDYRVFNNLAQVRITQKRWAEAETLLKQGAQVENVTSFRSLAVLYYDTGRYNEALAAANKGFEVLAKRGDDPDERAELHYGRGAIYWVAGRPRQAIEDWEAALRANPRHARAREWLATARAEHPALAAPAAGASGGAGDSKAAP